MGAVERCHLDSLYRSFSLFVNPAKGGKWGDITSRVLGDILS